MTAAEISAALGMAQRRAGWWPCQVQVARRKQIGSERHPSLTGGTADNETICDRQGARRQWRQ